MNQKCTVKNFGLHTTQREVRQTVSSTTKDAPPWEEQDRKFPSYDVITMHAEAFIFIKMQE